MTRENRALSIGHPKIMQHGDVGWRLECIVTLGDKESYVWFSVESKYAEYLCAERSDAFLIGLLPVAMRRGLDIVCEAPVSERLLYQLRSSLLPLLSKYGKNVHEVKIEAPVASEPIVNAGGVGAGISCGIDSLHIVKNCSSDEYPGLKLTHLVINNVGAFGETGRCGQYQWTIDLARRFCDEYGYELIVDVSNKSVENLNRLAHSSIILSKSLSRLETPLAMLERNNSSGKTL